ncbi:MAG: hypothetical protein HZA68_20505 [Rhodovulum sp.]|nr:hypothetical protein [Rhodovulum sp.]
MPDLVRVQTRTVEWMLASLLVAWGLGVLAPGDALTVGGLAALLAWWPETAWGAAIATLGAARLVALWINGRRRQTPIVRVAGSFLGAVWWAVIWYALWAGTSAGPRPASMSYYPVLIGFELFSIYRGAFDARRMLGGRPCPPTLP